MLLKDLVGSAKRSTEILSDLEDEDIVGYLSDSIDHLTLRLGITFQVSGANWDELEIVKPEADRALVKIIVLQAKQIAVSSQLVEKTRVGDINITYNKDAWIRDEEHLKNLIDMYADLHNITLPDGYAVFGSDEYTVLLNSDMARNDIYRALYGRYNF